MLRHPVQTRDHTKEASSPGDLELWAGAECTVNRVGDVYFDQLQRTGHAGRLEDLDRLAALGARRVRFPVLWERTAPHDGTGSNGFDWSDSRLQRLTTLGVAPIVGLVHHGSGPRHTGLCDAGFAQGLAAFAAQVAARYPWVDAYTPVNEPLTTARFSALYGLWYPHARQLALFYRALVNQVLATRASMREIRRINPGAEFYSTEDLGQVFSTPDLDDQCRYENERRWLSLDLLFGRVDARHPLRRELEQQGVSPRELDDLVDDPCPPDLVGINYYVTSDRFLDSRVERYPRHTWGGNGRAVYADVEAVRTRPEGIIGHRALLDSVWQRYRTRCAFTEVHLACHREDQLRWVAEAWQAARAARDAGVDVRAVTLWSAFGAVGWNNLVTRDHGEYEPGVYDVRGPSRRPTALAPLAKRLSRGECPGALASGAGWWRRRSRLLHPEPDLAAPASLESEPSKARVLVVGHSAFAGRVVALCQGRFAAIAAPTIAAASRALASGREEPWAMILAFDPNAPTPALDGEFEAHGAEVRARCNAGLRVLALSSHRVFDGWSARPYRESDRADPADRASHGWRALEASVGRLSAQPLVVRGGLLMDPTRPDDPLARRLHALRAGSILRIPGDEVLSPIWLPHWLDAALDLLVDGEQGVWHLAPHHACSALELTRRMALAADIPFRAEVTKSGRAPMRALASERGWPRPDLDAEIGAAIEAFTRAHAPPL